VCETAIARADKRALASIDACHLCLCLCLCLPLPLSPSVCVCVNPPSHAHRAIRALTSRLIFLAGVKWSCLRINKPAFPLQTSAHLHRSVQSRGAELLLPDVPPHPLSLTHTLSPSLSLSHTHTHTHSGKQRDFCFISRRIRHT